MTDLDPDLIDLAPDLTSQNTSGASTAPITCPDIVGMTTLNVLSCVGPGNAAFELRQGDTQPPLTLQLLDGNGEAISLSGATLTACFIVPGQAAYSQQSDMDGVTAKYERRVDDYVTLNSGRFYFLVTARWPDGTGISCPDAAEAVCLVLDAY